MAELKWGSATHPGQIRPQNEDNLLATNNVFVVADGMGGHEAGEVAAKIAVDRVGADLNAALHDGKLPEAAAVVESIANANGDIFRAAIANPGQQGMGTTVTAIAVIADRLAGRGAPNLDVNDDGAVTPIAPAEPSEALVLANVGDSRTYLLRHGRMRRVTVDHSYVQELVSTGHITEDEARTHPRRNIITRALGIEPDVKVDWWTLPLIRGDRFLLCSDGLVDEVADSDILETMTTIDDPQAVADRLVVQANEAGGRDNITVIVLDVIEGDEPPDPTQEIDVIPTWADDGEPTPSGSLEVDADTLSAHGLLAPQVTDSADTNGTTDDATDAADKKTKKKSDRGPKRFFVGILVAALLVAGFAIFAAWARGGYYIEFDDDDVAVVYKGQTDGVLWFSPTVVSPGPSRDLLTEEGAALIDERPRFDSREDAQRFLQTAGDIPAPETSTTEATPETEVDFPTEAPTSAAPTTTSAPTTAAATIAPAVTVAPTTSPATTTGG